jgi:hypothetical protein
MSRDLHMLALEQLEQDYETENITEEMIQEKVEFIMCDAYDRMKDRD